MGRDPRAIHEAEQLGPWLKDMANVLAGYRKQLRDSEQFSEDEIGAMVRRMEFELFGFWDEPDDGINWEPSTE